MKEYQCPECGARIGVLEGAPVCFGSTDPNSSQAHKKRKMKEVK